MIPPMENRGESLSTTSPDAIAGITAPKDSLIWPSPLYVTREFEEACQPCQSDIRLQATDLLARAKTRAPQLE